MASRSRRPATVPDRLKYGFFALIGLCVLMVAWVDERFLFDAADPHWRRIAAFTLLLGIHGLSGVTALVTGTLQMSGRIRRDRPALHRALGNTYLIAVCISAPFAIYIGHSRLEPVAIHVQQIFQGGLWLGTALVAWLCIRSGQMALHRDWMIRSYGFTLVFVLSRIPDVVVSHYSDQFLSDMLWSLIVAALIAPDAIMTARTLVGRAARRRAAGR